METRYRPAVRVVCLDSTARVLLFKWRDPFDGALLWEPPGGGIEDGETPLETARRELAEETGLDPDAIEERFIEVHRDVPWNGKRFVGPEQFFLARFDTEQPELSRDRLLPDERENLQDHMWAAQTDLVQLPDRLEPPNLADVIAELTSPQ